MKKNILITGINGFLGSHLAKHLKHSFEVIGLEYRIDNLFRIENEEFIVYESSDEILESIFKNHKIHAVVHVATVYRRQGEPILNILRTNINLPVRLLELANKYKVKQFLNTDSFFNDAKHSYSYLSDYTLSKKQALEWIKLLANATTYCKVANMKIFHMYGENDASGKFIPFILQQLKNNVESIDLTQGEQTRDFIYIKDVVDAYQCVLANYKQLNYIEEFQVATGNNYSIKEFVKLAKNFTGSVTKLNFGALPYREGEIMQSQLTNKRLFDLGWKPKFSLYEGLKCVIRNF